MKFMNRIEERKRLQSLELEMKRKFLRGPQHAGPWEASGPSLQGAVDINLCKVLQWWMWAQVSGQEDFWNQPKPTVPVRGWRAAIKYLLEHSYNPLTRGNNRIFDICPLTCVVCCVCRPAGGRK